MNPSRESKRRDQPLRLVMLISLIIANARPCGAESSGEYLQKAMIELQELNMPSNMAMHDRLSMTNHDYHTDYQDDRAQYNTYRKLSTNNAYQQLHPDTQKAAANLPVKQADMAQSASNNIVQFYAVGNIHTNLFSESLMKKICHFLVKFSQRA